MMGKGTLFKGAGPS